LHSFAALLQAGLIQALCGYWAKLVGASFFCQIAQVPAPTSEGTWSDGSRGCKYFTSSASSVLAAARAKGFG